MYPSADTILVLGPRLVEGVTVLIVVAVSLAVFVGLRFLYYTSVTHRVVRCPATGDPAHVRIRRFAGRPQCIECCSQLPDEVTCAQSCIRRV